MFKVLKKLKFFCVKSKRYQIAYLNGKVFGF